jgi:hypothetical protein
MKYFLQNLILNISELYINARVGFYFMYKPNVHAKFKYIKPNYTWAYEIWYLKDGKQTLLTKNY